MITALLASFAVHSVASKPAAPFRDPRAIALTWGGTIDTDIDFAAFWDKDFTLSIRFMPQFPFAYAGPLFSVQGTGNFQAGMGDYFWEPATRSAPGVWPWRDDEGRKNKKPNVMLWSGSQQIVGRVPMISAGKWYQLAVVKSGDSIRAYIDGIPIGAAIKAGPAPVGKLRIGRAGDGRSVCDGRAGQFYGLVDDLALVGKALSDTDLKTGDYAKNANLTGSEPDLLAGIPFDAPEPNGRPFPLKLNRKYTLSKTATPVSVSASRSSDDKAKFSVFTTPSTMILPVPANQEWYVIQGYADGVGSHNGYAAFCVDIDLAAGQPQTKGVPFTAAAMGFLTTAREDYLTGNTKNPNAIIIRQNPGYWAGYFHLQENSFSKEFQNGEWAKTHTKNGKVSYPNASDFDGNAILVKAGDPLARVSSVGAGATAYHLHYAVSDLPDLSPFGLPQTNFATIPAAFRNFEVKQPNGTWKKVSVGYLEQGMVIRRVE